MDQGVRRPSQERCEDKLEDFAPEPSGPDDDESLHHPENYAERAAVGCVPRREGQ